MKRLIMLLISTVMMSMSLTAADIVTVHGEFTYYGSKTESRADCERNALNGARAKALAEKFGTVVCCGGGVGVAPLLPILTAMKEAGNRVISVLAARTKDLIILEDQVRAHSDEVIIMTDDGSYGRKGLVTDGVESVIQREKVDKVVTIGPAIMMKFVSLLTKKYDVPTICSLNTIMVDGTGMCGACRVTVDGKMKFVCVDGPEFDAHKVNFDEMLMRLRSY